MTQLSALEVNEPLRIEGEALVSCLEMQMRTGRAACRAAETYDIAGIDPIPASTYLLERWA